MIEFLSGTLKKRSTNNIIIDVNGVGYGVEIPLTTLYELPKDTQKVELWIFTRVREDALKLYGFLKQEDRQAFEVLLMINGVGPKVALAIMSTLTVSTLVHAAETNQPEIIQVVPGIGKSKAEKILVELKSKVGKFSVPEHLTPLDQIFPVSQLNSNMDSHEHNILLNDLYMALENLGYKQKDVTPTIKRVLKETDSEDFGDLMKLILTDLSQGKNSTRSQTQPAKSKSDNSKLDTLF